MIFVFWSFEILKFDIWETSFFYIGDDPNHFHYATHHIPTMRPNISPLCDPTKLLAPKERACGASQTSIKTGFGAHLTICGTLWLPLGALGSLWVPLAPFGCPWAPWAPFGSSLFTVCDACRQNRACWNTAAGAAGDTGAHGSGVKNCGSELPSTRAGGQDHGSYTNSLK